MSTFSSPTAANSPPSGQLTPRSKIQALMARFDEGSDDDDALPSPTKTSRVPLREVDGNRAMKTQLVEKKGEVGENKEHDAEMGAKNADTAVAKIATDAAVPKVAIGAGILDDSDDSASDANDRASVYQRIRAQMLNRKLEAAKQRAEPKLKEIREESSTDEDEDDEIVPRGRMAARLQSKAAVSRDLEGDPIESSADETTGEKDASLNASPSFPAAQPSSPPSGATPPTKRRGFILRKKARAISPARSGSNSPTKSATEAQNNDASDQQPEEAQNSRFLALVARKREERLAREAEDEERRRQRLDRLAQEITNADRGRVSKKKMGKQAVRQTTGDESEDDDPISSQILQEHSRPTRKASKKALEEMSKETQRISRNMQLAHQARTKKKISKESLLQRFNFRTATPATTTAPATSSSAPHSDNEGERDHQTPPTSPVSVHEDKQETIETNEKQSESLATAIETQLNRVEISPEEDELLNLDDVLSRPKKPEMVSTVAMPIPDSALSTTDPPALAEAPPQQAPPPRAKATALKNYVHSRRRDADSDSDLEVVPRERSALLATFERVQPLASRGVEGKAMKTLRTLAHLTSPDSKKKVGVSPAALQASLRQKARLQAAKERADKIQDLRDRGVVVRTEEERERDQAEFEDMLEKARKENEELAKKEKSEAKKEAQANGEELPSSDEDDEEYKEADDEAEELELSGSEDEHEGEDEDEDEVDEKNAEAGLVDDQAADTSEEESEVAEEAEDAGNAAESEDDLITIPRKARRALRIVDDEDEEDLPAASVPNGTTSNNPFASVGAMNNPFTSTAGPNNPFASTETSPQNPFAQAAAIAPMGLTQAFAATMADSQDANPPAEEQDSLAQLDTLPDPDFLGMGQDSMPIATQQDTGLQLDLHLTQSQVQYETLPVLEPTQSELPEPTQDMGFGMSSPVGGRFANAPPSTVDTIRASVSPVARRKGRLQRGVKYAFSDEEELADDEQDSDGEFGITADAFNVMKRAAQKAKAHDENPFDKKKSEAKEMVEEQAQESEDEYAGIGGASDDESGGEMDEAVTQMIDEGKVDVDERELAAFHANKERAADEKAVERLFKDINNGGLRRKRHAEFDLSDSDDDLEDRRRRKRDEFARMRKALLADEKVGKIAEDPKKLAFLRAIEDREDREYEELAEPESQDTQNAAAAEQQEVPDSQPAATTAGNPQAGSKRKRPLEPTTANSRRRMQNLPSKPLSLSEIRASVSFLTEDPREFSMEPSSFSDLGSDADDEGGDSRGARGSAFSRRNPATAVIDRLSLKRGESLQTTTASATARMAFQAPDTSAGPGFRVPSLLRRATTGLSSFSESSYSSGSGSGGRAGSASIGTSRSNSSNNSSSLTAEAVKRGASKKSSVNYVAREAARRTQIDGVEKRKTEGILKARKRGAGIGGLLGCGSWE